MNISDLSIVSIDFCSSNLKSLFRLERSIFGMAGMPFDEWVGFNVEGVSDIRVATFADRWIGYVSLFEEEDDDGSFLRIHMLGVHADYRCQGVGTAMIGDVLAPGGRVQVLLFDFERDEDKFFRDRGFRAVGVQRKPVPENPHDVMVLEYRERD